MDPIAHTTPSSREALRTYLRNRRLSGSVHQATSEQTLSDLEEAIRLLRRIDHPSASWAEEVEAFLSLRDPKPLAPASPAQPGLFEFKE